MRSFGTRIFLRKLSRTSSRNKLRRKWKQSRKRRRHRHGGRSEGRLGNRSWDFGLGSLSFVLAWCFVALHGIRQLPSRKYKYQRTQNLRPKSRDNSNEQTSPSPIRACCRHHCGRVLWQSRGWLIVTKCKQFHDDEQECSRNTSSNPTTQGSFGWWRSTRLLQEYLGTSRGCG